MGIPNAKTIAGRLDLIRDKYNDKLTDDERNALIIAANVVRESCEIAQENVNIQYRERKEQ
jgi:hypothetical protein